MKLKTKTRRTLSAATFLAATMAAILLLNIVVGVAADKIQLRWDLTENKIYALTDETKAVLKALDKEVTLYYFASAGQENAQILRTLDMYKTASGMLKIIQSDPNTDPISARRFTDKGIAVQQNTIVLERGERYRAILPSEMYQGYTTQTGQSYDNAYFALEQGITRAVAYVASDKTQKTLFTVAHSERDSAAVIDALQKENMETYQIDLKTEEIPDEMDAVYIMAPAEDFTEEEILKLDAFLSGGKGAHICLDARQKPLPRLEQYLKEFWGVTLYHDLVCEGDSSRTLNYSYMFVPDMGQHTITEEISAKGLGTVFMFSRSLALSEAENVEFVPLATTTDAAFSVHGSDRNVTENIREGKMALAAAMERKSKEGNDMGRLVVSGSYQMYDAFFMDEAALGNRSFLYGAAKFINHDESALLSVSPKSLFMRMVMLSDSMTVFYIVLVGVVPALGFFAMGIRTWKRRRHL